jgi:GAF domain-containing protein
MADFLPLLHEQALRVAGGRASVFLRLDPRAGRWHAVSALPALTADSGPWLVDDAGRRAVDRVLAEGAPLIVDNIPHLLERLGAHVVVIVPVRTRDEPLGVLVVGSDDPARASAARDELSAVGDLVADALEGRRRQREGHLHRELRTLVSELTRAVSSSLHLHASLRLFCERAARLLDATAVNVWLHDRRAHEVELVASSSDVPTGQRMTSDAPPASVMRGTRAVRATPDPDGQTDIILPLRGSRRALGILTVSGLTADPTDEIDDLDRLEEVARQVSAAIENVLLLEDVLTSRRELESTFNSMADLVVVVDGSLAVTHANRAFAVRTRQRGGRPRGPPPAPGVRPRRPTARRVLRVGAGDLAAAVSI